MHKRLRLVHFVLCFIICFSSLTSCSRRTDNGENAKVPVDGWVLIVSVEGPHWLGTDWWESVGVDPSTLSYDDVKMQKDGEDIPYLWIDDEDEKGILFNAEVASTRSGNWGSYTLQTGEPGLKMAEIESSSSSDQACQEASLASIFYEQNNSYRSTATVEYPWLWISLHPPNTITLTIPLTRSIAGPITVTTTMWGQSRMPQNPDHHIRLIWDGSQIEDHFWDGNELEQWDTVFISEGNATSELVIASPGETEAPVEVNWLDNVKITWRKSLVWSGEGWERWYPDGLPEACWLNPSNGTPISILVAANGQVYHAESGDLTISQEAATVGWVGNPLQAPGPFLTRHRELLNFQDLLTVEYLVVAPQVFHKALTPLMEQRSNQGLVVSLNTPEQIYDTFGQGIPEGRAINAMVTTLASQGQLGYVLLVGDTSTDIDITPEEMLLQVPTEWVNTSVLGETPSDFALVSDETGIPVAAVGRFPASNESEVAFMVNKTLDWKPTQRMLFVGDDEVEFDRFIDKLAAVSPNDDRVNAGETNARMTLLSWLREDVGIMIYSGHGSLPMLGDEKLLTQEDAGNWDKPTVVLAWSCLCASFTHPSYQGLGESWLKSKKGTVVFVGPTGETSTAQQSHSALAVQESLVAGERIGDALLRGWLDAQSGDVKVSFLLLGDPALQPFSTESE